MTTRHDPALGKVLGAALIETERRVDGLRAELDALRSARDRAFTPPPAEWIAVRVRGLRALIERHTDESAERSAGCSGRYASILSFRNRAARTTKRRRRSTSLR